MSINYKLPTIINCNDDSDLVKSGLSDNPALQIAIIKLVKRASSDIIIIGASWKVLEVSNDPITIKFKTEITIKDTNKCYTCEIRLIANPKNGNSSQFRYSSKIEANSDTTSRGSLSKIMDMKKIELEIDSLLVDRD